MEQHRVARLVAEKCSVQDENEDDGREEEVVEPWASWRKEAGFKQNSAEIGYCSYAFYKCDKEADPDAEAD